MSVNNSNLWVALVILVVITFLFVLQHTSEPAPPSSLVGLRLRQREKYGGNDNSPHGHRRHNSDWNDKNTMNDDVDTAPVVPSPIATFWPDEDQHVGAADGYRPPRPNTLAAQLAKKRRIYYNQQKQAAAAADTTPSDSVRESTSTIPPTPAASSPATPVAPEETYEMPLMGEDEDFQAELLPSLSDFNLEPRVWPLPKGTRWPGGNGKVASLGVHVKLTTNVGSEVIDALWPLIFISTKCTSQSYSITKIIANADKSPSKDDFPHGDNEGYTLTIDVDSVMIKADTEWGVINALKTLAQMIQWKDDCAYIANVPVTITDEAQFGFRGFLIDPPRAFIQVQQIRAVIDRMAVMKMNVLHLRLTDDQSFLIESKKYPGLNKGQPNTYSQDDIRSLLKYARARGVRIVPEIDIPGHAKSWGRGAHPELVARCPSVDWSIGLDPTQDFTWKVLEEFLEEMMALFPDPWFHLGGDEVSVRCYDSDNALMQRARQLGQQSGAEVLEAFTERFHRLLQTNEAFKPRTFILWEDLYENHKNSMSVFRKDIVFHTWLSTKNGEEVADHGYRSLRSSYLYFNEIHDPKVHPNYDFQTVFRDLFTRDWYLLNFFGKKWQWKSATKHLFKGAIGCIWENPYSSYAVKVWPLLPAVAERLWSAFDSNADLQAVHRRLDLFQSYVSSLALDERHATSGGTPQPLPDYNAMREAAGAKLGARDNLRL